MKTNIFAHPCEIHAWYYLIRGCVSRGVVFWFSNLSSASSDVKSGNLEIWEPGQIVDIWKFGIQQMQQSRNYLNEHWKCRQGPDPWMPLDSPLTAPAVVGWASAEYSMANSTIANSLGRVRAYISDMSSTCGYMGGSCFLVNCATICERDIPHPAQRIAVLKYALVMFS